MKGVLKVLGGLLPVMVMLACGPEELPSRNEIPVLRQRLALLQEAVMNQDRAGLDSLLAVEILEAGQSGDSLLSLVYGPEADFAFAQFGDYTIFYGHKIAVLDCYIMDSTGSTERPLKLTYRNADGVWLLEKFRAGLPDTTTGE